MNALCDGPGFEPEIIQPTDRGLWGSEVEPGHFIVLSGDISQNKIDSVFESRVRERESSLCRVLLSMASHT